MTLRERIKAMVAVLLMDAGKPDRGTPKLKDRTPYKRQSSGHATMESLDPLAGRSFDNGDRVVDGVLRSRHVTPAWRFSSGDVAPPPFGSLAYDRLHSRGRRNRHAA